MGFRLRSQRVFVGGSAHADGKLGFLSIELTKWSLIVVEETGGGKWEVRLFSEGKETRIELDKQEKDMLIKKMVLRSRVSEALKVWLVLFGAMAFGFGVGFATFELRTIVNGGCRANSVCSLQSQEPLAEPLVVEEKVQPLYERPRRQGERRTINMTGSGDLKEFGLGVVKEITVENGTKKDQQQTHP